METIGKQKIWSFFDRRKKCAIATNTEIRKGPGHKVDSFIGLAKKVAELQFRNRDHVLLFRGQSNDYRNRQNNTTLKPTLFRPGNRKNPDAGLLMSRFRTLERAEQALTSSYQNSSSFIGVQRLQRHRILRWSILQHYEVCPTPLLDVTHSLRIAASFASMKPGKQSGLSDKAFLYVLGVPNLSGAITASAEAGLQIVRLSSVCPPQAVRPHIQEGYLLGEYPEIPTYQQKARYEPYEVDFGLRLVAKFWFNPHDFWKQPHFPMVPKEALYPDSVDPLLALAHGRSPMRARRATAPAGRRRAGAR
jgi:hypothetical protein